ncbi:Metal-dependent protein hydrolase [Macrophomina phaseolina MS6]|uniref:Metal-dependent protein hydrolase n=1 Tax=Macrophomina phaseolina (strain MS6) TaxID=1126212 RepID=K2SAF9_MACPH|nr:Metal-dependent protein hydrolase [Macrophomina phaseolina MS6]
MTSASPQAKRLKMTGPLIGTHNGHFHADEALAVYLLRTLPTYGSSPLVRTRDPAVLETCHTVVDVGGVYDHAKNRYDHHQREFDAYFPGKNATKLSSAGLVYKHFGKDIIAQQTGLRIDSEDVEILYQKLYEGLIEAFDANDTGVSAYDTKALKTAGVERRFEDRGFSIASVVNRYNYHFEDDTGKSKEQLQQEEDERFLKASAFVGEQFIMELTDKHRNWLPARAAVKAAFDGRKQYDPQGRIMVLKQGMPWADHLYTLESESNTPAESRVLYVLFPESDEADSKWRIRAVSVEGGGFENRKDLPDAWKGVRDEKLDEVSGIPGCVFVHASGFIGGNKTYDGALKMAQKALE